MGEFISDEAADSWGHSAKSGCCLTFSLSVNAWPNSCVLKIGFFFKWSEQIMDLPSRNDTVPDFFILTTELPYQSFAGGSLSLLTDFPK